MAQILIRASWLKAVCKILSREPSKGTSWTVGGDQEFRNSFPGSFQYEAHKAFKKFLFSSSPTGCEVKMDYPSGITYEFFFMFKGKKTYGKILLRDGGDSVKIFSAHLPMKKKLRCE